MDTFQEITVFCAVFGLTFIVFQVWWEKKRGANVRDLQVSKRIVYRSLPILLAPVFFASIPWKVRIVIIIVSLIIMQCYFLFIGRMRRVLGTEEECNKDKTKSK